jgi:transposase
MEKVSATGRDNQDIAAAVGVNRQLARRWRNRYARQGLTGIAQDAPGRGRKPRVRDAVAAKIIHTTTQTQPGVAVKFCGLAHSGGEYFNSGFESDSW